MELEENFAQELYSNNSLEMLPKCSVPSLVAPEPPVSPELSLFDAKIMKLSTFQTPRKRRFKMGICDDSCHWCVNNV